MISIVVITLSIIDPRVQTQVLHTDIADFFAGLGSIIVVDPVLLTIILSFIAIRPIKYYISTRELRQKLSNSSQTSYVKLRRHYKFGLSKWTSSQIVDINRVDSDTTPDIGIDSAENPYGLFIFEPGTYVFTINPAVFKHRLKRIGRRSSFITLRVEISSLENAQSFETTVTIQPSSSYVIDLYSDRAEWSEEHSG